MMLAINSDNYPKHYKLGLCNGDCECLLWGRNWIFKWYL